MLPPATDLLDILASHPEITNARIVEYEVSGGTVLVYKIRCDLPRGYSLQIRLRLRGETTRYAYQLFGAKPVLRWDNAPHFPGLASFPHHFHDETDVCHPSSLSGDPMADLPVVLSKIIGYVNK